MQFLIMVSRSQLFIVLLALLRGYCLEITFGFGLTKVFEVSVCLIDFEEVHGAYSKVVFRDRS